MKKIALTEFIEAEKSKSKSKYYNKETETFDLNLTLKDYNQIKFQKAPDPIDPPAPLSAFAKLTININNFALIKFNEIIEEKKLNLKNRPKIRYISKANKFILRILLNKETDTEDLKIIEKYLFNNLKEISEKKSKISEYNLIKLNNLTELKINNNIEEFIEYNFELTEKEIEEKPVKAKAVKKETVKPVKAEIKPETEEIKAEEYYFSMNFHDLNKFIKAGSEFMKLSADLRFKLYNHRQFLYEKTYR